MLSLLPFSSHASHLNVHLVRFLQGLCADLEAVFGDEGKARGVVVGYDHRALGSINSQRFGVLTATALFMRGFKVHMFPNLVCTPLVVRVRLCWTRRRVSGFMPFSVSGCGHHSCSSVV